MSSTKPTAPMMTRNMIFAGAADVALGERLDADAGELLVGSPGYAATSRSAMPFISVCASRRDAASASRPKTRSERASRLSGASVGIAGAQTSVLSGNRMPSGMTPTIVAGCPFTRIGVPSTFGSLPYRFFQKV